MNAVQKRLAQLPELRERLGAEHVDKLFCIMLVLAEELDIEMDGVQCPGTAAAIINRFRSILDELK